MALNPDLQALRDYVTAPSSGIQNANESTVRLVVTHSNLSAKFLEIKLDLHVSITLASPTTSYTTIPLKRTFMI